MAKCSFLLFTALLQFYESQFFFLCSSLPYNEGKITDALHISFQLQAILTKRKHSNSQLDIAPVKSIELSQITPTMNLTLNLKLQGEERRKSDTNCDGRSLT